jgi:hypothetical protein
VMLGGFVGWFLVLALARRRPKKCPSWGLDYFSRAIWLTNGFKKGTVS